MCKTKKMQPFLLATVAVMSAHACATGKAPTGRTAATMQTPATEASGRFWFGHPGKARDATRTIVVTAGGMRFSPARISVGVGQTVRFEIVNHDDILHEFLLGDVAEQKAHEREMASMPAMSMDHDPNGVTVGAGKTAFLTWTFTHPGTLQYACHEPGHYAAGMFGWLTVRG